MKSKRILAKNDEVNISRDAESDDVKNFRTLVIVVVLIVLFFKYC